MTVRGVRAIGLTHFFGNDIAGSMHGTQKGGLTPLGRAAVQRMEKLGKVVDIAHASHAAVAGVLAMATRPVVSSHEGVQATCKVSRNLSDDEIKGVARTGGVIGIGFCYGAVCGTSPAKIVQAMIHLRDLLGIDHVGLGSDFDGATTTGFDAAKAAAITQALLDAQFFGTDPQGDGRQRPARGARRTRAGVSARQPNIAIRANHTLSFRDIAKRWTRNPEIGLHFFFSLIAGSRCAIAHVRARRWRVAPE
jgi:hypothetical protein